MYIFITMYTMYIFIHTHRFSHCVSHNTSHTIFLFINRRAVLDWLTPAALVLNCTPVSPPHLIVEVPHTGGHLGRSVTQPPPPATHALASRQALRMLVWLQACMELIQVCVAGCGGCVVNMCIYHG